MYNYIRLLYRFGVGQEAPEEIENALTKNQNYRDDHMRHISGAGGNDTVKCCFYTKD